MTLEHTDEPRTSDVVVVGAGLAGLAAADALHAAGAGVRVLEARDRLGGRTLSRTVAGGAIDLGATWFWPGDELVAQLVRRFGLSTFDQDVAGDALLEAAPAQHRRVRGNPIDVPARRLIMGAHAMAERLAGVLPAGAIHLSTPVTALRRHGDGVLVEWPTGSYRCHHVVLAVPPALAAATIRFCPDLPAQVRDAAAATATWMGHVVKAVAVYERPFWRDLGLAGAAISYAGPFQEMHDHSGPEAVPAALFGFADSASLPTATPPTDSSRAMIAEEFRAQLVRLFGPSAERPRDVLVQDWSAEAYTAGPVGASRTAGSATFGHPAFHEPLAGRIHWAATETSAHHPGHMEGALAAGRRAAAAVLDQPAADNRPSPLSPEQSP